MAGVWQGLGVVCVVAVAGCSDEPATEGPPPEPKGWHSGTVLPSLRDQGPRGLLDVRGLIHAHSVYSHDACDGEPRDPQTDAINEPCFADFRRDMCRAAHDFIFLTDHGDSFRRTEYPDTLLYRDALGDALVERDAIPVANHAACDPAVSPEGSYGEVLIMAGTESATMAVGLEGHVADSDAGRSAVYGEVTTDAILTMQAQGALVLAQHTEDWTPEQIQDLGFDGFEMYNLHANTITGAGGVFELLGLMSQGAKMPASDLILLNIMNEDTRYLETWATVLAMGNRRVTTIGTDCHRNTFPTLLDDGERIDSYRRMMVWMSNHLLVTPEADGSWDDTHLKDALADGRLYGAFEVLGYPQGFDFHADGVEMGGEASLAAGVTLRATMPTVRDIAPDLELPTLRMRMLRAETGGWVVVEEGAADLTHEVAEAGAYRVEVRMTPGHLRRSLGVLADLADEEFVWIYSNPIYVLP